MVSFHSFWHIATSILFLTYSASAVILSDFNVPPTSAHSFSRRAQLSGLDLKNAETFMWSDAANGTQSVFGNLTVFMPGTNENILSMSAFRSMTKSVQCTNKTMDITFTDDATFAYAKQTWDWVNGADNHSFVMVAGNGDCGWNTRRIPFVVSTLEYDEMLNVAHLTATASSWKDAIHSYDLHVGRLANPTSLTRRGFGDKDFDKDASIDFNHKLANPSITFPDPDLAVTVACPNCGTTGTFDLAFHLHTEFLIPKDATLTVTPKNVSAFINPKVTIAAELTASKELNFPFPDIPIGAIEIPDVLTIGPAIETAVGISAGPVKGSASITAGVTFGIPDSANAVVDLLGGKITNSDWTPTVTTQEVKVDARIQADLKVFAKAAVAVKAEALGQGFEAQVKIEPFAQGSLQAIAASAGACADDPKHQPFGVSFFPTYGINLIAEINKEGKDEDPIASVTLANVQKPLPSVCFPFGSAGSNVSNATAPSLVRMRRLKRRARLEY